MSRPLAVVCALFILVAGIVPVRADTATQEELIERSRFTFEKLAHMKDLQRDLPGMLQRAKAVLIFPQILKGAFFIGGAGGTGVLMARNANGMWSDPAFYTLGSVSLGLQIGGQASEAVIVIMTEKGLEAVLDNQVKLGGDVSIAAGPVGMGVGAGTGIGLNADMYTYQIAQGLFFGGALDGAVIARRQDYNTALYGPEATPRGIVIEQRFSTPKADALRQAVARY